MDDKKYTKTREVAFQFIRFNLVGIVNTALTFAVYAGLVFLGVHHFIALAADYAVGIAFSFVVNKRLTFRVQGKASAPMLARMIVSYGALLGVNAVLLWLLVDQWGVNTYLGQALALAAVALLSFAAQRLFVFRPHKEEPHGADH